MCLHRGKRLVGSKMVSPKTICISPSLKAVEGEISLPIIIALYLLAAMTNALGASHNKKQLTIACCQQDLFSLIRLMVNMVRGVTFRNTKTFPPANLSKKHGSTIHETFYSCISHGNPVLLDRLRNNQRAIIKRCVINGYGVTMVMGSGFQVEKTSLGILEA